MLTPQEVASHAFARATFGGYNMAMVDEFLDTLTTDYTTLYNDNAILKNKLKVLSDTVEEYRATDVAMRKTLLAAQQMAENMVSDAEKQKQALVQDAESQAKSRLDEMRGQYADEEYRLQKAREATAAFLMEVKRAQDGINDSLSRLGELTAGVTPEKIVIPDVDRAPEAPAPKPETERPAEPVPAAPAADLDATRRFDDLQFGKDYEIT